ncbi:coiled-coil domain-containing protein [Mameliella alba]|uniref:Phage tape measure protein n=1 Tax=Mameliella alba TaxID=561184 RepID=A0A0B3RUH9_9RHOB|nr:hypothetical protein [Mameliella alba]KHQ50388.1 Phage tape measure protein [Mameliella alba]
MVQRKVTYRAELAGGQQVEGGFKKIGDSGRQAYEKIDRGQKSAETSAKAFERMLDAEERQFKALKASIDPAYAAQMRFERAQAQVNRAVKLGVTSQQDAAQVLKQLEARSRGAAQAMELVDTASVGASMGLRNSLLQVNQIGQQVAAGGNLMSAVAIQLPDILGGFGGILPLIAGAAVGLGAAFIPKLFEAEEAAEDLRGTLESAFSKVRSAQDAAREAQDRYTAAIRLSGRAQSEVTPEILQSLALEAKAREALAKAGNDRLKIDRERFQTQLQADRAQLDAMIEDATRKAAAAVELQRRQRVRELRLIDGQFGRDDTQFFQNAEAEARVEAARRVLAENRELVLAIREQQAELDAVNAKLMIGADTSEKIDALIKDSETAARDLASAVASIDFSNPIKEARELYGVLRDAASAAYRVYMARAEVGGKAQLNAYAQYQTSREQGAALKAFEDSIKPTPVKPSGGGGGGAASREANRLDQEALRIRRATTTALEKYNAEMRLAQELLETGRISQEVYNRHVEATKEAYRKASEGQQQFTRYVQQGRDAVINTIMGQKNAFDQLKQAIARAAIEYALYRTIAGQPVTGGIMGLVKSVVGGLLPSFDTRGYTGNGPRSGGVDGKGGMMAVVHPGERWSSDAAGDYRRGSGGRQQDIPFIGIGDGVQVQWMRAAEARSLQQLGGYAQFQRQNFGAMIGELQGRGTL